MDEEIAIAPEQAPPAGPAPSRRTLFGRSMNVVILVAILVAALLAESVIVFRGSSTEQARDDVLDVSRRFVALLTTYNATTIERQRTQVLALSTGKFRGEYEQLTGSGFIATLKERQADQQGKVVRIAVTQVRDETATVIALVQISTTNKDTKTPRVDNNLLELSLVETSGGWRIDAVTILGSVA
jgi:hypothetical protein